MSARLNERQLREALASSEERVRRLEALVTKALCKCVRGPYWTATNGCPIHPFVAFESPVPSEERG